MSPPSEVSLYSTLHPRAASSITKQHGLAGQHRTKPRAGRATASSWSCRTPPAQAKLTSDSRPLQRRSSKAALLPGYQVSQIPRFVTLQPVPCQRLYFSPHKTALQTAETAAGLSSCYPSSRTLCASLTRPLWVSELLFLILRNPQQTFVILQRKANIFVSFHFFLILFPKRSF